MLKSIIIVDDYAFVNGGAASVAITSAIYLANNTDYDVYYFAAVGPVSNELRNANFKKLVCLDQYDILHNPNKIQAFAQGVWNTRSKTEFAAFLQSLDSSSTIIHIHTWTKSLSSSIFNVAESAGYKTVVTLHDYFVNCPNGGYFNYQKSKICNLKPLSIECVLSNCDSRKYYFKLWRVARQMVQNRNLNTENTSFIYISNFSKNQIEKRTTNLKKLFFVENPVAINGREKINAEQNNTYLYLGRLSEEKGIRMFCEVVERLNLDAIVIGDGPLKDEMESKYHNFIQFKGWLSREEIKMYFKQTRCLIFTSLWYETLGLTVLEALSFGIPCVVPDNCAASDLITNYQNGIIYESGNIDSLSEAIQKLDDSIVKTLSNQAFDGFDESRYSISNHASNLLKVYTSIVDITEK